MTSSYQCHGSNWHDGTCTHGRHYAGCGHTYQTRDWTAGRRREYSAEPMWRRRAIDPDREGVSDRFRFMGAVDRTGSVAL